jgi:hypothetical protein
MSGLHRFGVAGLTLIVAACMTVESRSTLVMSNVPCLPPGVNAAFFSWPVVQFEALSLATEGGDALEGAWVLYRRRNAAVAALWTRNDLVAVDPRPDTDEPYWVDGSLVSDDDDSVLRATPEAPCQWRRHREAT